jgi:zinc and cadmium transporter
MDLFDLILLFASVIISGSVYFLIKNPSTNFLKLLLSFSGAFLFAISVLHLMPEVYKNSGASIGIWIMLGFFLQIVLELFSEGIEHGHIHVHSHHHGAFPLSMILSLSLHSFLEGMPLATISDGDALIQHTHSHSHEHSLLYGIILHHIPVAFALVSMLIASGISKTKTFFYLFVFASMAPLGAVAGILFQENAIGGFENYYNNIMALVIGIFLHISTTILFESGNGHRFNIYKLLAIITGGLIGIISFGI